MKKLILAAVAASLVATPVFAKPNGWDNSQGRSGHEIRYEHQHHEYNRKAGKRHEERHVWKKGDRFDARKAPNYRSIDHPQHYHLNAAPHGYKWVGSGHDAVLIGITSGIVAAIVFNAIH